MTIGDLLSGNWTWWQLVDQVLPVFIMGATAFYAGYQRGRRVELQQTEALVDLVLSGPHVVLDDQEFGGFDD